MVVVIYIIYNVYTHDRRQSWIVHSVCVRVCVRVWCVWVGGCACGCVWCVGELVGGSVAKGVLNCIYYTQLTCTMGMGYIPSSSTCNEKPYELKSGN